MKIKRKGEGKGGQSRGEESRERRAGERRQEKEIRGGSEVGISGFFGDSAVSCVVFLEAVL